ncbi:thioredoxin-domain-containing protein [Gautieria morchelliformis]|nr:thioredoxin-domain-containing protein [Gautieria morchelliformis]
MTITHLTSTQQLSQILSVSKDKLSVIDFHATWCGPCHAIAPVFEKLAKQYTNVNFLKCDVDAVKEIAQAYQVSAMPTFIFLKGSQKVDQVRGADARALESTLKAHSSAGATGAFSGKGQTLGSSSAPQADMATAASTAASGLINLDPQVKLFLGLIGAYLLLWYFST